jgi:hypothetical protein
MRPAGEKCDCCGQSLRGRPFVDGKTQMGQWAEMCSACAMRYGVGFGVGKGQAYDADGEKIGDAVAAATLEIPDRSANARSGGTP